MGIWVPHRSGKEAKDTWHIRICVHSDSLKLYLYKVLSHSNKEQILTSEAKKEWFKEKQHEFEKLI